MNKVTIFCGTDLAEQIRDFELKKKDPDFSILANKLDTENKIIFQASEDISKGELSACDVLIIEDEFRHYWCYIKLLNDASLVQDIVVVTKPKAAFLVFEHMERMKMLEHINLIIFEFFCAKK